MVIASTSRPSHPSIEPPRGRDDVSTPFSRDPYALRLSFLARSCMKAPFFEGTDSVSMFLYALDRNAVEKSASCELHRVSEAYRPHPPFSAHFERTSFLKSWAAVCSFDVDR